jgi:ubiquinone biosynthesis protein
MSTLGRWLISFLVVLKLTFVAAITKLVVLVRIRTNAWRNAILANQLYDGIVRLSGVYIKFGQVLSTRGDILPEIIANRLQDLLDKVPAEPLEDSLLTIEQELGDGAVDLHFGVFQKQPLAAASFSTVYQARLLDGDDVVVKVQRRDIDRQVQSDLLLLRLVALAIDMSGVLRRFRLRRFIAEFDEWTRQELDYEREGRHIEYLRDHEHESVLIRLPRVVWTLTRRRVMVQEYFEGVWFTDHDGIRGLGRDLRETLARGVLDGLFYQIFEVGFFHSDPHPGNLCYMQDGRVGLVDFGIVGQATAMMKESQLDLLWAIQSADTDAAFDAVLRVSKVPPDADIPTFRRLFERNLWDWQLVRQQPNTTANDRSASKLMFANFAAARQSGILLHAETARYYRAVMLIESLTFLLNPEFDLPTELNRYFRKRFLREAEETVQAELDPLASLVATWQRATQLTRKLKSLIDNSLFEQNVIDGTINSFILRSSRLCGGIALGCIIVALADLGFWALTAWGPVSDFRIFGFVDFLGIFSGNPPAVADRLRWIFLVAAAGALVSGWVSRVLWIEAYRDS